MAVPAAGKEEAADKKRDKELEHDRDIPRRRAHSVLAAHSVLIVQRLALGLNTMLEECGSSIHCHGTRLRRKRRRRRRRRRRDLGLYMPISMSAAGPSLNKRLTGVPCCSHDALLRTGL